MAVFAKRTGRESPREFGSSASACIGAQVCSSRGLGVSVYDMNTEQKVIDLPGAGPQAVAFSPK